MAITIPTPTSSTLKGYRTYITLAVGVAFVWLDHFYGLGLSDTCKAAPGVDCNISTADALGITWSALAAAFMRASNTPASTPAA